MFQLIHKCFKILNCLVRFDIFHSGRYSFSKQVKIFKMQYLKLLTFKFLFEYNNFKLAIKFQGNFQLKFIKAKLLLMYSV